MAGFIAGAATRALLPYSAASGVISAAAFPVAEYLWSTAKRIYSTNANWYSQQSNLGYEYAPGQILATARAPSRTMPPKRSYGRRRFSGRRTAVGRRSYAGRGRRGRVVRRKGVGRLPAVNRTYPMRRKVVYKRKDYNPPMGRLYPRIAGHMQVGEKARVELIQRLSIPATTLYQNLQVKMQLSDAHRVITNLATAPDCPDFYRTIRDWEKFKYTGMKLEIWMQPLLTGSASTVFNHIGRAYSNTNASNTAMIQIAPPDVADPVFNIEKACETPGFRHAQFTAPFTRHEFKGKRRPFFKRYSRAEVAEMNAATGYSNWNTIGSSVLDTPLPTLSFVQMDQYISYNALEFLLTSATLPYMIIKKTFYLALKDRRPAPAQGGLYAPRIETTANVAITDPPTIAAMEAAVLTDP